MVIKAEMFIVDQDTIQGALGVWMGWNSLAGLIFAVLTPVIIKKKSSGTILTGDECI